MKTFAGLLRIHQWVKNLFIFAAAFFGGVLLQKDNPVYLTAGFFCFCAISSAIYILNDLRDAESDRLHPEKKKRPIASGAVSVRTAVVMMAVLAIGALVGSFLIWKYFFFVIATYALVNVLYSFGLKKVALVDILMVSSGFILRVLAGGILAGVVVSHWLMIMTFLFALFIAIAKRRDDVLLLESTGTEFRKSIKGYNIEFVNISMGMMAAVIIVSYILYITSPEITARFHGKYLYASTFFVIVGLMRYLQITLVEKKSGSPTKVFLSDIFMQVTMLLWVAYFAVYIYVIPHGIQ